MSTENTLSTDTLLEQLAASNKENLTLITANNKLKEELRLCKEFFGYNEDSDINALINDADECDEDERNLRELDSDYNKKCENAERLAELVIELGELQYSMSNIYSRLKTLGTDATEVNKRRKALTTAFIELKNEIMPSNITKFFALAEEWLQTQLEMAVIDDKLSNITP